MATQRQRQLACTGPSWLLLKIREMVQSYGDARMLNPESVPRSYEIPAMDKNGKVKYVLLTVSMIPGTNDRIVSSLDITERKQTDEKLRESKEFAENLISFMKDGFSLLDNQGVHLSVNDALCHMTGFTKEELIGVGPPHPYWPREQYQNIQKTFQDTLEGKFAEFELIFKRKNGKRFPVIVSPSWLKDKEGNIISYFATIKDISSMMKMRKQIPLTLRPRQLPPNNQRK